MNIKAKLNLNNNEIEKNKEVNMNKREQVINQIKILLDEYKNMGGNGDTNIDIDNIASISIDISHISRKKIRIGFWMLDGKIVSYRFGPIIK